ncbi:response regulator transcription factor [Dyadobacter pollutisoli]|uniref:Response regulator transcription factor n=1 Tax=Dyadobacter pollutisoli TaxID=2910158 RepID=A0A9E8NGJ1_9BACT|nr:response regulator transcription factor [Dyadobacter pollutisoli]WAC14556.1 response regulator transcription factor [Dyadobacter pollutisoli]
MKKILHVENHGIVRLAIRYLISEVESSFEFYEASSFGDAIQILEANPLDLLIMDVLIPQGDGFRMITRIREIQPDLPILVLTQLPEELYAIHYLKAGVSGFISKSASNNDIRDAIHAMMNVGGFMSKRTQRQLINNSFEKKGHSNPLETLSQRELEVMEMLLDSRWTKEIAQTLHITESSVSTYKARIFEKLKVVSMIELYIKVENIKNTGH